MRWFCFWPVSKMPPRLLPPETFVTVFYPRIFPDERGFIRIHSRKSVAKNLLVRVAELRGPGAGGVALLEEFFRFLLDFVIVVPTAAAILVRLVRAGSDE